MGVAPFEVAYVFDDVDDIYWAHEVLLTDLLNENAPKKEKRVKSQRCPFINSNLRKATYKKAILLNKVNKWKTANWEAYRKQRNITTKLKRLSIRTYFDDERCTEGTTSTDFSPTVNPFFFFKQGTSQGHCYNSI